MPTHRATLIQDLKEYHGILKPYLDPLLQTHAYPEGLVEEDILKWIIAEEVELIYGLFCKTHMHNGMPHMLIHSTLRMLLPIPLSNLTKSYIKAPKLYNTENLVNIQVIGRDLYIYYFASDFNLPYKHLLRNL